MGAPTTDRGGIQQVIRALKLAGWEPYEVDDGGDENEKVTNETEAIDAVMAVDAAHMLFKRQEPFDTGYVFFVLGNDPEEVVCDYTTNLDPTVDELVRTWW
jgi:methylaspartate ammonia-lyase